MCGILSIYNRTPIKTTLFKSLLKKIQHRGQDSYGYTFTNPDKQLVFKYEQGIINIDKSETDPNLEINNNKSNFYMGHTRYTTSGSKSLNSIQPIYDSCKFGKFILSFNGNIALNNYLDPNTQKKYLVDSQLIINFIKNESKMLSSFEEVLIKFTNQIERAYSIVIYYNNNLYCIRDRYGVRPLLYYKNNNELIITSETCVNSDLDFTDIEEGSIIKFEINDSDIKIQNIYKFSQKNYKKAHCLFEYIYFMNTDSTWNKQNVGDFRQNIGKKLAAIEESYIVSNPENYIVIGIPNSGIVSAKEYAEYLGIRYEQLIRKNKKINRTFILKDDNERDKQSKEKYIYDKKNLKGKNVILFDDSIVRGITIKNLISSLKSLGVEEIHIRVASPPIKYECFYGIDIPTREELIINQFKSIEDINNYLDSTTLKYINLENIKDIISNYNNLCTGCFNKNYNQLLDW